MIIFLMLLLIVVLTIVYPWIQNRREEELAQKLEARRTPEEALALLDAATLASRREGDFLRNLPKRHL